jgi:hypothetical protein
MKKRDAVNLHERETEDLIAPGHLFSASLLLWAWEGSL